MISLETLLNAYIDANLILLAGAAIWAASRAMFDRSSLRHAHSGRLKLLYGMLLVVGIAPFAVMALWPLVQTLGLNLSDIVVAEYLAGRFAMAPTTFETLLGSRDALVLDVVTFATTTGTVIAAILLAGICAGAARAAINITRVRSLIADSYLWRRSGRVDVRVSDSTDIPFSTRGWRRHSVILPVEMLTHADDLRIALSHEFQHLRQGDLSWEVVLELLRPLFVFNPAFAYLKRQVEQLRELACDQKVLDRKNLRAQDYANCLLRACTKAIQRSSHLPNTMPAVGLVQAKGQRNADFLRLRVSEMIHGRKRPAHDWLVVSLLIPLTCAVALASVALQRSGDWSQDRLMLSTIVNLERLDQRNGWN